MKEEYMVGRIIARPFLGESSDTFYRTTNRHDYALSPTDVTTLDNLKAKGYDVISIGKINDIFNTMGITVAYKTKSNHHGMEIACELAAKDFIGLCFSNLVDFDALYGHRRDVEGYKRALEEFDSDLGKLIPLLGEDDLLIVSADHGNDPTAPGSDHTREYVPLVVYRNNGKNVDLGTRDSFADIGQTIAENFGLEALPIGKSFLNEI
jgi:phosphopentomutase